MSHCQKGHTNLILEHPFVGTYYIILSIKVWHNAFKKKNLYNFIISNTTTNRIWPIQLHNDTSLHTCYFSWEFIKLWLSIVSRKKVNDYKPFVYITIYYHLYHLKTLAHAFRLSWYTSETFFPVYCSEGILKNHPRKFSLFSGEVTINYLTLLSIKAFLELLSHAVCGGSCSIGLETMVPPHYNLTYTAKSLSYLT